MWRTIGIAFKSDRGYRDDRCRRNPLFHMFILRVALSQTDPPAIVVDHNGDVVRIIERRCRAIERGIIELPLRRSKLPDQLVESVCVFCVAPLATFGGEIE